MHNEFRDSGFKVFGLNGANSEGKCNCGNQYCEAPYKHPISSGWQHTPDWSDEQWEIGNELGQFNTGYGVLCCNVLVIDIDARNGGIPSYTKLAIDFPSICSSGLIVETGSGGGSKHLYFLLPDGLALQQHLNQYPGIDFKSSGFVVGPGSMHASGKKYKVLCGSPSDIGHAPQEIIDLLKIPYRHRTIVNGSPVDVSFEDISNFLSFVDNEIDYDAYMRIGMAIHHATGGSGFDVWDKWAQQSSKYTGKTIYNRWQSFGKSSNPVTLGTLINYAEQGGYQDDVTFVSDIEFEYNDDPLNIDAVDLLRPPGFVGEVAAWIESNNRRPREKLSVAAAIVGIGNVAGLKYIDEYNGVTANLFAFCVAGSRTGKEGVQQSLLNIMSAAGITAAVHGNIKSEQEIIRNLALRHQAAFYLVDEIGILLQKIKNAQEKGSAAYLDGVIGILMSAYGKADGYMPITGDTKDEIKKILIAKISKERIAIDNNETDDAELKRLTEALSDVDKGLKNPFLSLIGFTTPVTFDNLVDYQSATNGFIGRSLIFNENNTAPRSKPGFKKVPMPLCMQSTIASLWQSGEYDAEENRVASNGDKIPVPTNKDAIGMLDEILNWFEDKAIDHSSSTGLEALYLGAYELVSKVSFILAIPGGCRTSEHVLWAFALVKRDIDNKAIMVMASAKTNKALQAKILHIIGDDGAPLGLLCNRIRGESKDSILECLNILEGNNVIIKEEKKRSGNDKPGVIYRKTE